MRVYRWFLLQFVVLSALQDFMLHREWTVLWHICATLVILIPWPMLDISRYKMASELERTYPSVIYLMEEKNTFLMYTFDMHPIWFPLALLDHNQAFVPFLFEGIPVFAMIVSAFCLKDVQSSTLGRITVSVSSFHAIITSLLTILLHKPFRDRV
ncbi:hypothetical protein PENTCL1PPCAC_17057, partial [Pristionchus entomophagus]